MSALPNPSATRLQNLIATLRLHGNRIEDLNLSALLSHNQWTDEEAFRGEWAIQQNGSRKLPEEVAAATVPAIQSEDIEE